MEKLNVGVNVAPSSTSGHFIKNAKKVVDIDAVNETFLVEGESVLTTENHTTLEQKKSCLITTQVVYNPLKAVYEKSKD
jgi:hypothetical protein